MSIEGKKIFITGSTGGIGTAICNEYLNKNCILILTSSSEEKLEKLKKLYGNKHSYYKLDLSDINNLEKIMQIISKEHKDIDVLVNNAGITNDALLLRMKYSQWSKVMNTNLNSNFIIIKSILPSMIAKRNGKIIGISSVVALTGNPGQSNYTSSKGGMISMYKSLALEVAKRNINVNLISPGFIVSSMTDQLNEDQKNNILQNIPMKKFGKPEDVASLVLYLSSDEASYITGQNFHVNGGMLMV
jgi:3-oxoacyl-[acyl-carrier protein] reductase